MNKRKYNITVTDPSGAPIQKQALADSPAIAGERAIEMAKRTSRLPMMDRIYGAWSAVAVME